MSLFSIFLRAPRNVVLKIATKNVRVAFDSDDEGDDDEDDDDDDDDDWTHRLLMLRQAKARQGERDTARDEKEAISPAMAEEGGAPDIRGGTDTRAAAQPQASGAILATHMQSLPEESPRGDGPGFVSGFISGQLSPRHPAEEIGGADAVASIFPQPQPRPGGASAPALRRAVSASLLAAAADSTASLNRPANRSNVNHHPGILSQGSFAPPPASPATPGAALPTVASARSPAWRIGSAFAAVTQLAGASSGGCSANGKQQRPWGSAVLTSHAGASGVAMGDVAAQPPALRRRLQEQGSTAYHFLLPLVLWGITSVSGACAMTAEQ